MTRLRSVLFRLFTLPLCLLMGAPAIAAELIANANPMALYGSEILFDVYRNGDKVGFHRVRFAEDKDALVARSLFQIDFKLLFFLPYRYAYKSEARWRNGALVRLSADVDDDGDLFTLSAIRKGDLFEINTSDRRFTAKAPVFPTNHWNAAVIGETRVLNTVTGSINKVRIEATTRERVATELGDVEATRYSYSGDLRTTVWYDDQGRWVKKRFRGSDGSDIDYVC
ncbi:MAG: DUF6134 family protein, partial [Pseudomonadota bacterium]